MEHYPYFPLFTDLSGKRIVIVGGGNIAARRALTLLDFTETLTVVSPDLHPDMASFIQSGRIVWKRKQYSPADLTGADYVLAATNDGSVNDEIYDFCKQQHIPVNVCTDHTKCDFLFPGIARKGDAVVGMTSGGTDYTGVRDTLKEIRALLDSLF